MGPRAGLPPRGWMMCARTAAKELQRAGFLTRKERKRLVAWIENPEREQPDPSLSAVLWAVWMWQATPGSWAVH